MLMMHTKQHLEVDHNRVCVTVDDHAVALIAVGFGVVLLHDRLGVFYHAAPVGGGGC